MNTIGREVLFISAEKEGNKRNSSSILLKMENGEIMLGYTEFLGDGWDDHHPSQVSARFSADEGESFGEKKVLVKLPCGSMGIHLMGLCNIGGGEVGLIYASRTKDGSDRVDGEIVHYFIKSKDFGKSWSEPVNCMPAENDFYCMKNDAFIKLKNGRLLYAVARHSTKNFPPLPKKAVAKSPSTFAPGVVCFFYSDDMGETWHKADAEISDHVYGDVMGWQEPGICELESGELWCYVRTILGYQYSSYSEDGGKTWSRPIPDRTYSSPHAPMAVENAENLTLAVFNPVAKRVDTPYNRLMWRTPIVLGVSEDGGITLRSIYHLETDPENAYCYPAIEWCGDYVLIVYEHSNNSGDCHNSLKVVKIMINELKGE